MREHLLGKCVVHLNCRRNKVGCERGRRYASSENAPRPFLLLFRFEFTGNRMARWRAYSELVINPWKPPTRGLLWEIASIMTPIFICFLHCLILKFVHGLLFAEGFYIMFYNNDFKQNCPWLTPRYRMLCWLIDHPVHSRNCCLRQFHCSVHGSVSNS